MIITQLTVLVSWFPSGAQLDTARSRHRHDLTIFLALFHYVSKRKHQWAQAHCDPLNKPAQQPPGYFMCTLAGWIRNQVIGPGNVSGSIF